jgi:hypothetical protein
MKKKKSAEQKKREEPAQLGRSGANRPNRQPGKENPRKPSLLSLPSQSQATYHICLLQPSSLSLKKGTATPLPLLSPARSGTATTPASSPLCSPALPLHFSPPLLLDWTAKSREFLTRDLGDRRCTTPAPARWSRLTSSLGLPLFLLSLAHLLMQFLSKNRSGIAH